MMYSIAIITCNNTISTLLCEMVWLRSGFGCLSSVVYTALLLAQTDADFCIGNLIQVQTLCVNIN